jgi:hypothetical protein
MRRPEQVRWRVVAVAVLAAPWVSACSTDLSSVNLMPKFNGFESLSLEGGSYAELRQVTAADLVGPDGQCAGAQGSPTQQGIALQMTECEVVQRAGTPENVEVGTNERGDRAVTLTYNGGPRPGIYRFAGGRLFAIDRVAEPPPEPAKPKKPAPKKQKSA